MKLLALAVLTVLASACAAHGPGRSTLGEALRPDSEEPRPEPSPTVAPAAEAPEEPATASTAPKAGPFSAGFLLGVGVPLSGGEVQPLQLATGLLKVESLGERSVNLLALGGVSTSIPKDGEGTPRIRGTWGLGAGVELTPGNLVYQVNASVGVLWMTGVSGPVLAGGAALAF